MKATTSSLTAMAWFTSLAMAQVKVPPEFNAGESLKWQIEIQNTLDTSKAVTPSVPVWDVDLYHVARTPKIIDTLRVGSSPLIPSTPLALKPLSP